VFTSATIIPQAEERKKNRKKEGKKER